MTTAQGLRKIATREWDAGHILVARDLKIGVRFRYPYLKQPLQDWLDEEPEGELANKLYIIGMNSFDPVRGHGYVELISMGVTTYCSSALKVGRISLDFSSELTEGLLSLLRREHQMHISELIRELEATLRATQLAGDSDEYLVSYGRTEASFGLPELELNGAESFGWWLTSFLASPSAPMPAYI